MVIGPLVIALPRLFFLLGLVAAMIATRVVERRLVGPSAEKLLWLALLIGLLVARLGFVLTHLDVFARQPLHALYLWQGGFMPLLGVLASCVTVALLWWRSRQYTGRQLLAPLVAALLVWGGLSWVTQALRQATSQPLPAVTLQQLDGQPLALASLAGQPVVLNIWATWCPPCRREMPMLAQAQRQYPGVHFVFVNQGEGRATISNYLTAEQLQLDNVLLDTGAHVSRQFGVRGLPTTLFFNARGELVTSHLGMLTQAILGDYLGTLTTAAAH